MKLTERLSKSTSRAWLAALVCWLAWPALTLLPAAQRLDNAWGDHLTRMRAERHAGDQSIVIVDIDEWSMQAMAADAGKWPWPRSVHAALLEALLAEQPRAVVFDIFFADKDILRPDDDAYFGEVLAAAPNVYLAGLQLGNAAVPALLASYPAQAGLEKGPNARADARGSLLLPAAVPETAWRTGPVNFTQDADGIGRRYDIYREIDGWRWPSLPARVARDLGASIPDQPALRIDFRAGGKQPYTRLLYREVYEHFEGNATLPAGFFKDRIVVLGTSASGLGDLKPTPIAPAYPGMLLVATTLDNLLHGDGLRELPFVFAWVVLGLLLAAVAEATRRARLVLAIAIGVAGIGLLAGASVALALGAGLITPGPVPALLLAACLGVLAFIQYRDRQAELARTVRTFERFMDPKLVHQVLNDQDAAALLASRTCEITVLFSDIRGFTQLSEKRSAVEVVRLLDDYFGRQVAVIFRHGGTLDKFIGDAVMAFWGAPVPHEAQHRAAVECALEMRREVERFRKDYAFGPDFDIGVGIHTGPAVVGMIGCEQRYDFTAIGDTVNLASRIEGLCKDRAPILVSAATRAGCGPDMSFRAHGAALVKGREEKVELFEPVVGGGPHANP